MAETISLYNHTAKKIANGEITLSTLKVMLRNGTTFNATQTVVSQLDGSEVSGNGWTAGGESIANAAVTTITTNDAKLDGDNIAVLATGGDIGPSTEAVLIDDTPADAELLAYIDFNESKTADEGTEFQVQINASGIITFTVT